MGVIYLGVLLLSVGMVQVRRLKARRLNDGSIRFEGVQDTQGQIEGKMPSLCGGRRYLGPSTQLSAGNDGITFKVLAQDDTVVVAKAAVNSAYEGEEGFAAVKNECAIMKLLESSAAPNALKCLGECVGSYRGEEDDTDQSVGVMITAPFLDDTQQYIFGNESAMMRGMRETLYAAAYMIGVGVINGDMARNTLHTEKGDTLLIDYGLAYVLVPYVNASLASLGLDTFGFVPGDSLPTLPVTSDETVELRMKSHIEAVVLKSMPLGVAEIERLWAKAWKDAASNRRFAQNLTANSFWRKIKQIAEALLYERLLHTLIDAWKEVLPYDDIALALKLAPSGENESTLWKKCKTRLLARAENMVDAAAEMEKDTAPYIKVVELLKAQ